LAERRLQPVATRTAVSDRLAVALSDRYRLERELGAGGMARACRVEALGLRMKQ